MTVFDVPSSLQFLGPWVRAGVFGTAEVHGAVVLTRPDRSAGACDESVQLAAALALWAPLHGHACIDLADADRMVENALARDEDAGADSSATEPLPWPAVTEWVRALQSSASCRTVTTPDAEPVHDDHALVLHGTLLYTQRQWVDECIVAAHLARRATAPAPGTSAGSMPEGTAALLEKLLPATDAGAPNRQHDAAVVALRSRLGVVVGGPGTGKTHTIARLLAVLIDRAERNGSGRPLRIALAAPTGKAAARMGEAISAAITAFVADGEVRASLTPAAIAQLAELRPMTLHRLLGVRGGKRTRFVHGTEHFLEHDVIVVDEASMIALPMMARLLEAIRPEASLVLVGDPDQLESIEVGAVLADIVTASQAQRTAPTATEPPARPTGGGPARSPLASCVVRLDRPRRHVSGSPIGPLADAVRLADADDVVGQLREHSSTSASSDAGVLFVDTDALSGAVVDSTIRNAIIPTLEAAATAARVGPPADALSRFADVRVLCAHRRGPHGVERWNRLIESWVLADTPNARPPRFYPGRPLLVTRNDHRQRIANGDTGIVVAHESGLRAAFDTAEGIRLLAPAQLDTVDTAFAMTIHKSQGSEYATVVVILPPADSALIGRELLYTAITRATRRLIVVGTVAAVIAAVNTPGRRVTGLAAALS